jgi:glycine cleavage system transcriptional repressor
MGATTKRYIISVLVRDRVGIIADVTETVFNLGGNIFATSQTIMHGWFTMILSADFPESISCEDVRAALGAHPDIVSTVCEGTPSAAATTAGEPFVVTVIGDDRPGIVRGIARCCADRHVNILDMWNEIREGNFIVILSVTIPPNADPKDIRYDLEQTAADLGVALTFQHQDIFTATNSLSVHTPRPSANA